MNPLDRLYNLLPVVYRQRDLEQGSPLQALLQVIAEQVILLENDIAHLYENWFIETCDDWVVPYIGDLIGYRPVRSAGEAAEDAVASLDQILTPRREVANTISYRRRKGTLALLDELSLATAGWPARAVEFDRHLSINQNLQHLRERRGQIANLRDVKDLDLLGTPFDSASHNVDVRSPNAANSPGKYNLPSVGLFVWRTRVYSATHTLAYRVRDSGDAPDCCYTFSILGNDIPLYTNVVSGASSCRIPGEHDLPAPIRRRDFAELTNGEWRASEKYYGAGKSVAIWVSKWAELDPSVPIPREKVIPADLSLWNYRPKRDHVAVDPELGRIAFPLEQEPDGDVFTSYYYGFSAEIGGGEYERPIIVSTGSSNYYFVGQGEDFSTIGEACQEWRKDKPVHAVIEVSDSGVYTENIEVALDANQTLELRAANGARPILFLSDVHPGRSEPITVAGAAGSSFALDGFLITGRGFEVRGKLDTFTLRHCTLVPGWGLHHDNAPRRANDPSLVLSKTSARVIIEHSILGPIHVPVDPEASDPLVFQVSDSIIDASNWEGNAICAPGADIAGITLTIARATVFGVIRAHAIALAENCIFMGHVHVARRQFGCMRFCYVTPRSRTPRRYHCQPDLVDKAIREQSRTDQLPHEEAEALLRSEQSRAEPAFVSIRYGSPGYCKLSDACAAEIKIGADDRSELGVFHDLYQPQREQNLRTRLEEFTPAGMDAGIIFAT